MVHTPQLWDTIPKPFSFKGLQGTLDWQSLLRHPKWVKRMMNSLRQPWNTDRWSRHLRFKWFRVFLLSPNLWISKSRQHRCKEPELSSILFRSRAKYSHSLKVLPLLREMFTTNSIVILEGGWTAGSELEIQCWSLIFKIECSKWAQENKHAGNIVLISRQTILQPESSLKSRILSLGFL